MKKRIVIGILGLLLLTSLNSEAQIVEIIKAAVTKVIKAVDLKIQFLQNKTIWLQNAQKALENKMTQLKLTEISGWVEKQRKLYDEYFQELWKVKTALAYYSRIRAMIERQVELVKAYQSAWALIRQDKNFTAEERQGIAQTYTGILQASSQNLDGLFLVVNAFSTQMSDAKRLAVINQVADAMEQTMMDLTEYTQQNKMISLQRAAQQEEIDYVKKLYGL